jgi:1-acyl-sn-glycerol-3-phosphate acyltransferase
MNATAETSGFVPGSPERRGFYERLRIFFAVARHLFLGLDVQGLENIPKTGGVIVASNHLSFWDIPTLAFVPRRMFHYMAKSEYAKNGFMRWLFTKLEAFFVDRGEADTTAIRNCLAVLKVGQVLAIYPEGHRSENHAMIPAHDGFALIAFKSGAPVVPVATWGSEMVGKGGRFLFWRPTIHIRYGKPIMLVPSGKKYTREDLANGTTLIMGTIASMLPPAYRGVYADAAARILAGETPTPASVKSGVQE